MSGERVPAVRRVVLLVRLGGVGCEREVATHVTQQDELSAGELSIISSPRALHRDVYRFLEQSAARKEMNLW